MPPLDSGLAPDPAALAVVLAACPLLTPATPLTLDLVRLLPQLCKAVRRVVTDGDGFGEVVVVIKGGRVLFIQRRQSEQEALGAG